MAEETKKNNTTFQVSKVDALKKLYADEPSRKRRQDQSPSYSTTDYTTATEVRQALSNGISNVSDIVEASKKLYVTNPIYANLVNYLANMYTWQYKVIPHKIDINAKVNAKQYAEMYGLMLEVVEGIHIESKFSSLLTTLVSEGAVYFTTICDEESLVIDTLMLPAKFCRKIGETQYGTAIINFDFSYFTNLGMTAELLKDYMKGFPKEFQSKYSKYQKDGKLRWQELDPHFSSGLMLNEIGMPTLFYAYSSILDFEKYQDNELQRSQNKLKYLVIHTMPHYEDKLLFEVDEVDAIHKSLKRVIETNDNVKLITTYGDVHVEKPSDNDVSENEILSKAYKAIFNTAGLNSATFTGESVEALKKSVLRDKTFMWKYVKSLCSFYNIAVNNYFDFGGYEADIDILPISPYTYNDDMETYKTNASLGVGKLDYIIAAGIKQRDITDNFELEDFLQLDKITPMQTSYTQSDGAAEERSAEDKKQSNAKGNNKNSNEEETEIEPSEETSKEEK